jgi:hypothetical protein
MPRIQKHRSCTKMRFDAGKVARKTREWKNFARRVLRDGEGNNVNCSILNLIVYVRRCSSRPQVAGSIASAPKLPNAPPSLFASSLPTKNTKSNFCFARVLAFASGICCNSS